MSRKRIVPVTNDERKVQSSNQTSVSHFNSKPVEDVNDKPKERKHLSFCKYCGKVHDARKEPCKEFLKAKREHWQRIKGTKASKYRSSIDWQKTRERVLLRDSGVCRLCLMKGQIVSEGIQVHHITKIEDNYELRNVDDNLISLCTTCHTMVEDVTDYDDMLRSMALRPAFDDLVVGRTHSTTGD